MSGPRRPEGAEDCPSCDGYGITKDKGWEPNFRGDRRDPKDWRLAGNGWLRCGSCQGDGWWEPPHVIVITQMAVPTEMAIGPVSRAEATEWVAQRADQMGPGRNYMRVQVFRLQDPP